MEETKQQNKKQIEKLRHQAFTMMLSIGVIIALPALVAFFVGRWLDNRQITDHTYTLIALGISFVLSWIIIIKKYNNYNKAVKAVEDKQRTEDKD
ncbi:MAG: AtpZ/AtpI family protein [Candidatus Komeilibacteria bacterium]